MLQLLYTGDELMHRAGLMILANLVSDSFDPLSKETKTKVFHAGVFERLKDFVFAGDAVCQTYAAAVVQNLCIDVRFARLFRQYELMEEFERLVDLSRNAQLRRYAAGALSNCITSIQNDMEKYSLENRGAGGGILARLSHNMEDVPELSEKAMYEITLRDQHNEAVKEREADAIKLLQGAIKKKKSRRAFAQIRAMINAVKIVNRWVRLWRQRRIKRAVLIVQDHFRAHIAEKYGICSHRALLIIIRGTRVAYRRSMWRCTLIEMKEKAILFERRRHLALPPPKGFERVRHDEKSGGEYSLRPSWKMMSKFNMKLSKLLKMPGGPEAPMVLPNNANMPKPKNVSARVPMFSSVMPGSPRRSQPGSRAGSRAGSQAPSHASSKSGSPQGSRASTASSYKGDGPGSPSGMSPSGLSYRAAASLLRATPPRVAPKGGRPGPRTSSFADYVKMENSMRSLLTPTTPGGKARARVDPRPRPRSLSSRSSSGSEGDANALAMQLMEEARVERFGGPKADAPSRPPGPSVRFAGVTRAKFAPNAPPQKSDDEKAAELAMELMEEARSGTTAVVPFREPQHTITIPPQRLGAAPPLQIPGMVMEEVDYPSTPDEESVVPDVQELNAEAWLNAGMMPEWGEDVSPARGS